MNGVLLDTNIVSELRKQERAHTHVRAWFAAQPADRLFLSVLTIGELRRGVLLVRRRDAAQADRLETWLAGLIESAGDRILGVDERVALRWAQMMVPQPRPVVDALLAATASAHGLVLATRNTADVEGTGVPLVNPFEPARR